MSDDLVFPSVLLEGGFHSASISFQSFLMSVIEMNESLNLSFKPRVEIIKLLFMKLYKNVSIQLLSDSHKETSQ